MVDDKAIGCVIYGLITALPILFLLYRYYKKRKADFQSSKVQLLASTVILIVGFVYYLALAQFGVFLCNTMEMDAFLAAAPTVVSMNILYLLIPVAAVTALMYVVSGFKSLLN